MKVLAGTSDGVPVPHEPAGEVGGVGQVRPPPGGGWPGSVFSLINRPSCWATHGIAEGLNSRTTAKANRMDFPLLWHENGGFGRLVFERVWPDQGTNVMRGTCHQQQP
jgi:hypothetical protein